METKKTRDQVNAWASDFLVEVHLKELTGSPASMVQQTVEKKMIFSLNNNDSGLLFNYTLYLLPQPPPPPSHTPPPISFCLSSYCIIPKANVKIWFLIFNVCCGDQLN